jgi:hypothetical protein
MTYEDWVQTGVDRGWIHTPVCATHDGIPRTEAEAEALEDGDDPCMIVLRVAP